MSPYSISEFVVTTPLSPARGVQLRRYVESESQGHPLKAGHLDHSFFCHSELPLESSPDQQEIQSKAQNDKQKLVPP